MTDREPEVGHELVLDNRKLIIVFAVFIAICGAFFVLGFMEGRRQGFQDGMQTAVETAPGSAPMVAENPAPPSAAVPKEEIAASDLDWYRNVNRSEGDPAAAPGSNPRRSRPRSLRLNRPRLPRRNPRRNRRRRGPPPPGRRSRPPTRSR